MATSYAFASKQQSQPHGGGERGLFTRSAREGEEVVRGLDADIQARAAAKLAAAAPLEAEACVYLSERTGQAVPPGQLSAALQDGVLLCELVNAIAPGIVKKIHRSRVLMFQNENVTFFQQACRSLGVPESNLFALSALRDGKDPLQVIHCLLEVKRMDRAGLLSLSGGGVAAKKASRWTVRDTGQPRERLRGERVVRGLDADIQAKYNAKLRAAAGLQASACAYLSARTGRGVEPGRMSEALMDGVLLCALLNTICPGAVPEVNVGSKIAFKHVENLTWFQEGARRLGVPESNLFSHSDLREGKDPLQVLQCVLEIKRRDEAGLMTLAGPSTKASRWVVKEAAVRYAQEGESVVRGLDADIRAKTQAKIAASAPLEQEACAYLSARTGRGVEPGRMSEALMDGVLLCALLNAICPGAVPEVNVGSKIAFKHVENLTWFQEGARRLGVPESNLFSHSDLREGKDPLQVLQCVLEIKRRDEAGLLHNTGVTPSRNLRMGFGSVDLPSTQHSVVHRVRQQSFEHRRAAAAASKEEQIHLAQEARDEEELQATLDAIDAATATATH
jgi:hypothetical protein